ncbi:recombinase family protein [Anaeromyxobacter sp. Red801]|uniref:recombinase family protein n=1 Tax=Anaeromyxobacter sp. Red801 TaxID=3411632 RepID=UPI003BA3524F
MRSKQTAVAAAYIRVSGRAQDHASQRSALERASKARGDKIAFWYAEKKSARTLARPELQRLREDARRGLFRRLYVFRLDRLARSGVRDTFEIIEEMRASGVEVVSIADGFSLDGPAAEVILAVISWAAKMERLALLDRIEAARERLASEGRAWGRPTRVSPAEHRTIQTLAAAGRTVREIAVAVKIPRSTVARALSRKLPPLTRSGSGRERRLSGGRTE